MDKIDEQWRERLEKFIEDEGMTMRSASLKAGKSHSYIYSLFTRNQTPKSSTLLELAEGIGMNPMRLIFGIDISSDEEELLAKFQKLSEEKQQKILEIINSSED